MLIEVKISHNSPTNCLPSIDRAAQWAREACTSRDLKRAGKHSVPGPVESAKSA